MAINYKDKMEIIFYFYSIRHFFPVRPQRVQKENEESECVDGECMAALIDKWGRYEV